ncbi:MAG TPA: TetR/AcrR family transcriptional regulator [Terriglobales bacterium]|nr:TetR/AcrR family transcriptional regulator [Terriglobales bacterium]
MKAYRHLQRRAEKLLDNNLRGEKRRIQRVARAKERDLRRRPKRPRFGTRGQPEESRAAILEAAVAEFAEYGIDGARTDRIAREAGVNKALLYYYFKDKDALYEAVLDQVFGGMREEVVPVLESDLPPKQKLLEYVARYFDYIAANPEFPRVVQSEMMRVGIHGSPRMLRIAREYFAPIYSRLSQTLREGAEKRELRPLNPMDFVPSMVGVVIFYFTTATTMKALLKVDPLAKDRIAERRKFVLDFISEAVRL